MHNNKYQDLFQGYSNEVTMVLTDRSMKQNRVQNQTRTHIVLDLRQMGKELSFHLKVLGQWIVVVKDNDSTPQHV